MSVVVPRTPRLDGRFVSRDGQLSAWTLHVRPSASQPLPAKAKATRHGAVVTSPGSGSDVSVTRCRGCGGGAYSHLIGDVPAAPHRHFGSRVGRSRYVPVARYLVRCAPAQLSKSFAIPKLTKSKCNRVIAWWIIDEPSSPPIKSSSGVQNLHAACALWSPE